MADSDASLDIERILQACKRIRPHVQTNSSRDLREASVCIVLRGDRDPDVLLIERAATLRSHAGQWGLPGGRRDPGETCVDTAYRELEEELGIPATGVRVLGQLDDFITRSGYVMSPVVMHCGAETSPIPCPSEVASVFSIRVSEFVEHGRFTWFIVPETGRKSVKMRVNGSFLYAPTAAILLQFRDLLMGTITRVAEIEQPIFAWR